MRRGPDALRASRRRRSTGSGGGRQRSVELSHRSPVQTRGHGDRAGGRRSRAALRAARNAGGARSSRPLARRARGGRRPPATARRTPVAGGRRPWRGSAAASVGGSSDRSSICSRSRRVCVDAFAVGLVDHEHVGDLHQAGLVGLHRVAPARVDDDDGGVGLAGDLDLDLPDADRLDDDPRADRPRRAAGPPPASASDSPPRWPRVAIDRMNTPGSVAWSCMRTRSPRIAPPVNGDDGSIASTATSIVERSQVADQSRWSGCSCPTPGAPVMPTSIAVAAARVRQAGDLAGRSSPPRSISDSRRASAARSPSSAAPNRSATGRVAAGHLVDVDDFGDTVDSVAHDALDAGLECLRADRTRAAGADEASR